MNDYCSLVNQCRFPKILVLTCSVVIISFLILTLQPTTTHAMDTVLTLSDKMAHKPPSLTRILVNSTIFSENTHSAIYQQPHANVSLSSSSSLQCIPSSINDFPWDGLTREERQTGMICIHLLIVVYVCIMLAIVCDDYFVPSLEQITHVFKIHPDVAGSTFMAVGKCG